MDIQAITLRRLDAGDSLGELTNMLHRAFSRLGAMGLNCTCVDQSADVTRERVGSGDCYVATCNGRLVGTITLYTHHSTPGLVAEGLWHQRPDVASVHQFAVAPDFQGAGLGGAMLDCAEDWARVRGYEELALHTPQRAEHLVRFYAMRGYRCVATVQLQGKNYRSVVLSKELGAAQTRFGTYALQALRHRGSHGALAQGRCA